jgi:hypothetical protein
VVPSVNGAGYLFDCLDAVRTAGARVRLEVLVVERCGGALRDELARRCPEVEVLPVPAGTSIPDMRAAAFRRARADAVAVIEDHVLVPAAWAEQMLAALAAGADVAGGSVANAATGTITDRTAFLCEYSHLLPGSRAGVQMPVTGNNVVYRRRLLAAYAHVWSAGRWEDYLHDALRRDGAVMVADPAIVVGHRMHYTALEYMSQRMLYARSYAGLKRGDLSPAGRLLRAAGSMALPPVLLVRILARAGAAARHGQASATSLPLLLAFVTAWAFGEMIGYLGGPGNALARVR